MSISIVKYTEDIHHGGFKSFLKKAVLLGIKTEVIKVSHATLIKLEYQGKVLFCHKTNLPLFRRMGNLTKNKAVTKTVLESFGIHTPRGITAGSLNEAKKLIREKSLTYPLICKPVDGSLAKGMTWDIRSVSELKEAIAFTKDAYIHSPRSKFLIEEMFIASEYRVLVFNGKVLSAVQKIPAGIIGNGISPLSELIARFNEGRLPGFIIKQDAIFKNTLRDNKLTLDSILPKDTFFQFRNNLNMSDGGRSVERTTKMHPVFKKICVQAIEAVGLTYGGIDFFAKDITNEKSDYIILEINPNPFYNMHEKPLVEGKGIDVSFHILKSIFPTLKEK